MVYSRKNIGKNRNLRKRSRKGGMRKSVASLASAASRASTTFGNKFRRAPPPSPPPPPPQPPQPLLSADELRALKSLRSAEEPPSAGASRSSTGLTVSPRTLPQPAPLPSPREEYVFICSTITPKLLEIYCLKPSHVTFGSMVYNLESMFGCGFIRGQPIEQNLVYLPVFLEAAEYCDKIGVESLDKDVIDKDVIDKAKQQNEINFMKKVLELLEIEVNDNKVVEFFAKLQLEVFKDDIKYKEALSTIDINDSNKILEILGFKESEILYKSYIAFFIDNLKKNLQNSNIDKYNIGKIKTMSEKLQSMKHSCTPMIDLNKFYTNEISNFVRGKFRLAAEKKKISEFVHKKILKELENNAPEEIQDEIKNFVDGKYATLHGATLAEDDPHRLQCLKFLKKLKNNGVVDEEIDRNGLYADFESFATDKRKLVEWLTKFVPYYQYENKEDLMHLANFLYCREYSIDKNFFPESKEDFFSMGDNLKNFYNKLNSEDGFKTKHNYTLIHDCEHGDANAVLLFKYLQSKNPNSKFEIIMQVSDKYHSKVSQDERMNMFFYDTLDNDNSHDKYHIQSKICGDGNFENSLDIHAKKKLAFLDNDFIDPLIPQEIIPKERLVQLKSLRTEETEAKKVLSEEEIRQLLGDTTLVEYDTFPSFYDDYFNSLSAGGRRRPTKRRRQTKRRRHTKRRR